MKQYKFLTLITIIGLLSFWACTDLEENILDEQLGEDLVYDSDNIDALIAPPYASLRHLIEWYDFWALQEITTSEAAIPTRGSDWDDNGAWRQLHLHTWTADHSRLGNVWDVLTQGISRANTAMYYIGLFDQNDTTEDYITEARFLRAYFVYLMADLYGQVPFREENDLDFSTTPEVMDRTTAIDYVISEINAVISDLKEKSEYSSERVTVGLANALLAKIYLNYEVYTGESKWDEAIAYCDKVIESGEYAVTDDYWSMFEWDVTGDHEEFIFTVGMSDQVDMGSGSIWINFTLHYNQIFGNFTSFWNGACTTSDFVNTWDQENDTRFYDDRNIDTYGFNQGFLVGQQYSVDGEALYDRDGNPLVFVPDFSLTSSDECAGIRVVKFGPNENSLYPSSYASNDFPLFRIAEIYLTRAEAKFRNGDTEGALADINYVRSKRSAEGKSLSQLTTLTLDDIFNERGFELYWEGYRRQDEIRFAKYGDAYQEKPATEETGLFYIPTDALDVNENLTQNP